MGMTTESLVFIANILGNSIDYLLNLDNAQTILYAAWIIFEAVLIYHIAQKYHFSIPGAVKLPEFSDHYVKHMVWEVKNLKSTPDPRAYLEGWFLDAKCETIGRLGLLEWLSDMLFRKQPNNLDSRQMGIIDRVKLELETYLNFEFQERPRIPAITLSLPISVFYRPLLFYGLSNTVDYSTRMVLGRFGFQRRDNNHLITYYKKGSNLESPIIFCHGRIFKLN
jgi:hypothetical protein